MTDYQKQFLNLTYNEFLTKTNIVELCKDIYKKRNDNKSIPPALLNETLQIMHKSLHKTDKWYQCPLQFIEMKNEIREPTHSDSAEPTTSDGAQMAAAEATNHMQRLISQMTFNDFVNKTNVRTLIEGDMSMKINQDSMESAYHYVRRSNFTALPMLKDLALVDSHIVEDSERKLVSKPKPAAAANQTDVRVSKAVTNFVTPPSKPSSLTANYGSQVVRVSMKSEKNGIKSHKKTDDGGKPCTSITSKRPAENKSENPNTSGKKKRYIPTKFQMEVAKMSMEEFRKRTNVEHILTYGPNGYFACADDPDPALLKKYLKGACRKLLEYCRKDKVWPSWGERKLVKDLRPLDAPDAKPFPEHRPSSVPISGTSTVSNRQLRCVFDGINLLI